MGIISVEGRRNEMCQQKMTVCKVNAHNDHTRSLHNIYNEHTKSIYNAKTQLVNDWTLQIFLSENLATVQYKLVLWFAGSRREKKNTGKP